MTSRARLVAAIAGLLTALLMQATLVAPVTTPWPVSLPAVLVAAVALVDGPATGMSFGFTTGLVADLGSRHPAGVLALCWLGVGLVCGMLADRHSVRRDALTAGLVCGAAAALAIVLLAVLHSGGSAGAAIGSLVPTVVGDALVGLGMVPLVRWMLRSDSLRAPHPVYTELLVGHRHG